MLIFLIGTLFRLSPVDKQKVQKIPTSPQILSSLPFNHKEINLPDHEASKIFFLLRKLVSRKLSWQQNFLCELIFHCDCYNSNNHGPKLNQNLWLQRRKKKQRTPQKQMLVVIKVEWGSNSFTDHVLCRAEHTLMQIFCQGQICL